MHLSTSLIAIFLSPMIALAVDKSISIEVDANFEPTAAVGIVLSKSGLTEHPAASFKRDQHGVRVELLLPENVLAEDATVTAMVSGAAGERAYGEMQALMLFSSVDSLPSCSDKLPKESLDAGSLEQLIDLRTRRRDIAKKQIAEVLSSDGLADKLANVEQLFGLKSSQPISAELPPLELLERLARINAAVESYRIGRQKVAAATPATEPASPVAPASTPQQ